MTAAGILSACKLIGVDDEGAYGAPTYGAPAPKNAPVPKNIPAQKNVPAQKASYATADDIFGFKEEKY